MQKIWQDLYNKCKEDKDTYKIRFQSKYKSGGEPYKYATELLEFLESLGKGSERERILELGTGFGFTTAIFLASTNMQIDTFEEREDHMNLAKENLEKFILENPNLNLDIGRVNFINENFENFFTKQISHEAALQKYKIIFFDGYSPQAHFLNFFEDQLAASGLLISANSLLGRSEEAYFERLKDQSKWEFVKEWGDTKIYKKC